MSLKKPEKIKTEYYDYSEVSHYLEKKHKKDFRDYKEHHKDSKNEYCDFWHYIVDYCDVQNGGFIVLPEINEDTPDWIKEILGYFEEFLGDDYYIEMRTSW